MKLVFKVDKDGGRNGCWGTGFHLYDKHDMHKGVLTHRPRGLIRRSPSMEFKRFGSGIYVQFSIWKSTWTFMYMPRPPKELCIVWRDGLHQICTDVTVPRVFCDHCGEYMERSEYRYHEAFRK
jgi:hypothetical protein